MTAIEKQEAELIERWGSARAAALAAHLELDIDGPDIESAPHHHGDEYFGASGAEWRVLTDAEADAAWDADLENYIDECIIPELPENMVQYFDSEKWKRDARMDGRGHSLSGYDGNEYEAEGPDGVTYYIYRMN